MAGTALEEIVEPNNGETVDSATAPVALSDSPKIALANTKNVKNKTAHARKAAYFLSFMGSLATGFQNAIAFFMFLADITSKIKDAGAYFLSALGGFCSAAVNYCMNINLLKRFMRRFTKEKGEDDTYNPKPPVDLKGWRKFRYYLGSTLFVITGILFGLTALAFGSLGPLAILGFIAAFFVTTMMIMQELETWLWSFETEIKKNSLGESSLWEELKKWWNELNWRKAVGVFISFMNVVALSLLFMGGLTAFLIFAGVAAFPALIAGFVVAFTAGFFTEFFFYKTFIADFCDKASKNWSELLDSPHRIFGISCVTANAAINGVLCWAGVLLVAQVLAVGAGIVLSPAALLAIKAGVAVFGGLASFLLGSDFWISMWKPKKPASDAAANVGQVEGEVSAGGNAHKKLLSAQPQAGMSMSAAPDAPSSSQSHLAVPTAGSSSTSSRNETNTANSERASLSNPTVQASDSNAPVLPLAPHSAVAAEVHGMHLRPPSRTPEPSHLCPAVVHLFDPLVAPRVVAHTVPG